MDSVLQQGIELIVWIQQFQTPALNTFFEVFTNFGGTYYLYMLPLVIWCVDYRVGFRLLLLFVLTLFLNSLLKDWIAQPRPFQMDERVLSDGEHGYGLPSGHAQLVVVFWGVLAAWVQRRWFWVLSVLIMFLMGFSRVYLGVHFPSDIIGGWLIGAVTLLLYFQVRTLIEAKLAAMSVGNKVVLLIVVSLLMTLPGTGSIEASLVVGTGGMLLGAGLGRLLALQGGLDFAGHGPWWSRLLRYVVGMVFTLALIAGMQKAYPADQGWLSQAALYTMMAILGFWMLYLAPRLFCLLRLGDERTAGQVP